MAKVKRFVQFEGIDKSLEIAKASKIKGSDKEFLYLEKMKNGKWRVTWTDTMFDELSDITCVNFVRED